MTSDPTCLIAQISKVYPLVLVAFSVHGSIK